MESALGGAAEARSVDAGRGLSWWSEGWTLFTRNAGMWIVLSLVLLVISIVLSVIPIIGGLALAVLFPVFMGGWMMAAAKQEAGGALEVGDLFLGFKDKLSPLAVIGALTLVASIIIMIIVWVLGLGAFFGILAGGSRGSGGGIIAGLLSGLVAIVLCLGVGFIFGMALWFAPALVVFDDVAPVDAMKASFAASLKNIVAFVLFGVIYIVLSIVASIPFGLGWIVLIPVLLLTAYTSYKDVFAR
ncbi:BPSS1780 family membrane protein [Aquabacterium sp.]|uniref:BPSS1780 family membrane protein n=1 Tax=Aquabacterium sp. TaxID=1872578 RepID=UPI0037844882